MNRLTLKRLALADLKSIARYTEDRWGRRQRNYSVKKLDDAFSMIAQTPSLGVTCDFILQGTGNSQVKTILSFTKSKQMEKLK
jgi:toxin ParE1/3/4